MATYPAGLREHCRRVGKNVRDEDGKECCEMLSPRQGRSVDLMLCLWLLKQDLHKMEANDSCLVVFYGFLYNYLVVPICAGNSN